MRTKLLLCCTIFILVLFASCSFDVDSPPYIVYTPTPKPPSGFEDYILISELTANINGAKVVASIDNTYAHCGTTRGNIAINGIASPEIHLVDFGHIEWEESRAIYAGDIIRLWAKPATSWKQIYFTLEFR